MTEQTNFSEHIDYLKVYCLIFMIYAKYEHLNLGLFSSQNDSFSSKKQTK